MFGLCVSTGDMCFCPPSSSAGRAEEQRVTHRRVGDLLSSTGPSAVTVCREASEQEVPAGSGRCIVARRL